ncbi:MAG: hydroxysqualene dehydroxylase HpnE [Planctomycetota bacterium]
MTTAIATIPLEAMRHCRAVTRRRARNFYYGLKLLPEPKRSALYAIYAWMRQADDIIDDGVLGKNERLARLREFRRRTESVIGGALPDDDPLWEAMSYVASRFDLPLEHFHALLDGQEDDLSRQRYETFEQLRGYCYRVASTVGLLCIGIWGYDDEAAPRLAIDRGIAFQLTNIIRDFAQDYDEGRVYLPADEFKAAGLSPEDLRRWQMPERCEAFIGDQVARARSYYDGSAGLESMLARLRAAHSAELDDQGRHRASRQEDAARHGRSVKRRIAIVGGGLAGLATAVRLAEHDFVPILIESRKRLGGRATSLRDPRSGHTIDNCQHVLLGCCTNLIDLYSRLGVLEDIEWHRRFYWTAGNGQIDEVRAGWLPAPLHLSRSFGRMTLLEKDERRAVARGMWRIIRLGHRGRLAWSRRTFSEFLDETGQPVRARRRFWDPVIVSACNLASDRVGADFALQVFQEGFLANRWSYSMGLARGPLADLYDPAFDRIREQGGEVRLGCSARAIGFDGQRVTGVITEDGMVDASAVVVAVPFDRLDRLVNDTMRKRDARLGRLDELDVSPILGVHLHFEQEIMDLPHLTLVDCGVQWLFNKGVDEAGGQHIHAVISAADDWMDRSEQEIGETVMRDVHRVLPRAVGLQPVGVRAIKEKRATFAPVPGVDALRPSVAPGTIGLGGGGIRNLFLAGDWCDTGWPATMEGAVRSGYLAAKAITGHGGLVEEVPPSLLSRVLGL